MANESPPDPAAEPQEVRLRDLRPGLERAMIVARVVTLQRREVTRRSDGTRRPVLSGLLSDGTATVRFTWWDPPPEEVDRGVVLRAVNVQVGVFRGRPEVSFTWRTRVGPAGPAELPTVAWSEVPLRSVSQVGDPGEMFRLEVRVARVAPKSVRVDGEQRRLFEGTVVDASGSLPFTAWTDFRLVPGEAIRVMGGYLRKYQGRDHLVLDERATVSRIEGTGLPPADTVSSPVPRTVLELEVSRGGDHVRTEGLIVGLMPPSGLVYRCPTCRRGLVDGACRDHGAVSGTPDLRARLVLDDGTGALTVHAGRHDTERLLGRTLEECLRGSAAASPDVPAEEALFDATFGRRVRVVGRATKDDFGVTIFPEEIQLLSPEPDRAVAELRRRLGGTVP